MSQTVSNIYLLKPDVKQYQWGIRGTDSRVARYALESKTIDKIDNSSPYAELWIGTHPSGPSKLEDGSDLSEKTQLPWLFKVLSAGKALSIQAHPDKELAETLHQSKPSQYKDDNHKPEMAIALTPFEAMCGFRKLEEIGMHLKKHPEFAACIDNEAQLMVFKTDMSNEKQKRYAIKAVFESFMHCDSEISSLELKNLINRLTTENSDVPSDRAILRLAKQFPGDPGAMAPLFLNYITIAPGESFFMAANEPHAYISGEILECMACSDNVVRAGLTPKFKDVPNLVHMLTYSMGPPSIKSGCIDFETEGTQTVRYTPPVSEFEVLVTTINPGYNLKMDPIEVPSIVICIEGVGSLFSEHEKKEIHLEPGKTVFINKNTPEFLVLCEDSSQGPLKIAVARENLSL